MLETYPAPKDGWVCFHCGERFVSAAAARRHFGPTPASTAACCLDGPELRRQLRRLRALERLLHGKCKSCTEALGMKEPVRAAGPEERAA